MEQKLVGCDSLRKSRRPSGSRQRTIGLAAPRGGPIVDADEEQLANAHYFWMVAARGVLCGFRYRGIALGAWLDARATCRLLVVARHIVDCVRWLGAIQSILARQIDLLQSVSRYRSDVGNGGYFYLGANACGRSASRLDP